MANVVVVDGVKYINVNRLVQAMVKEVVDGTDTRDLYIYESERDALGNYQALCNRLADDIPSLKNMLKDMYVRERFMVRTLKD